MRTVSCLVMTCAVLTALPVRAQPRLLSAALADPRVATAVADVDAHTAWTADLLTRLGRTGMTIVMVTHAPDVAAHAGRIIEMRDGTIVGEHVAQASTVPVA